MRKPLFVDYVMEFLKQMEASNQSSSIIVNETIRSDWILNELDGWLQN